MVFGQSGYIREGGCICEKCLFFCKSGFNSGKVVLFGQKWL